MRRSLWHYWGHNRGWHVPWATERSPYGFWLTPREATDIRKRALRLGGVFCPWGSRMMSVSLTRKFGARISTVTVRDWLMRLGKEVCACLSLTLPRGIRTSQAELVWVWLILRLERSRVVEGGRRPLPMRGLDETRAFIRYMWMDDLVNGVLQECLQDCLTRLCGRLCNKETVLSLVEGAVNLVLKDHVVPSEVKVCGPLGVWTWLVFLEEEKRGSRRRRARPLSRRDWCYFA